MDGAKHRKDVHYGLNHSLIVRLNKEIFKVNLENVELHFLKTSHSAELKSVIWKPHKVQSYIISLLSKGYCALNCWPQLLQSLLTKEKILTKLKCLLNTFTFHMQ